MKHFLSRAAYSALCILSVAAARGQHFQIGSKDPSVLRHMAHDWAAAQDALAAHPRDPKVRERFVTAGVQFGHESMISPLLPAKVKYRQAVLVYRKVLKVDPNNPVARPEYDLIISIYKQMHRPIPQ